MSYLMAEMTSEQIGRMIEDRTVALIPIGATEQHGRHLPVQFDYMVVEEVAKKAAQLASSTIPVIVTPTINFGCSSHHMDFKGTLSLRFNTFIDLIIDIGESLIKHDIKRLLFLNGHGGNSAPLQIVCRRLKEENDIACAAAANYWSLAASAIKELRESGPGGMGHAGEFETSLGLFLMSDKVRVALLEDRTNPPRIKGDNLDLLYSGSVFLPWMASDKGIAGVIGNATLGTKNKGKKFFHAIVRETAELIENLSSIKYQ